MGSMGLVLLLVNRDCNKHQEYINTGVVYKAWRFSASSPRTSSREFQDRPLHTSGRHEKLLVLPALWSIMQ